MLTTHWFEPGDAIAVASPTFIALVDGLLDDDTTQLLSKAAASGSTMQATLDAVLAMPIGSIPSFGIAGSGRILIKGHISAWVKLDDGRQRVHSTGGEYAIADVEYGEGDLAGLFLERQFAAQGGSTPPDQVRSRTKGHETFRPGLWVTCGVVAASSIEFIGATRQNIAATTLPQTRSGDSEASTVFDIIDEGPLGTTDDEASTVGRGPQGRASRLRTDDPHLGETPIAVTAGDSEPRTSTPTTAHVTSGTGTDEMTRSDLMEVNRGRVLSQQKSSTDTVSAAVNNETVVVAAADQAEMLIQLGRDALAHTASGESAQAKFPRSSNEQEAAKHQGSADTSRQASSVAPSTLGKELVVNAGMIDSVPGFPDRQQARSAPTPTSTKTVMHDVEDPTTFTPRLLEQGSRQHVNPVVDYEEGDLRTGTNAPLVVGVTCPSGHLNRPNVTKCVRCDDPIFNQDPKECQRPPLSLLLTSDGRQIALTRPCIVGRQPNVPPGRRMEDPELITISDPEERVSRSHLAIHLDGWEISVEDLNSTNGSRIRRADGTEKVLHGSIRESVDIGDTVFLDTDRWLKLEKVL